MLDSEAVKNESTKLYSKIANERSKMMKAILYIGGRILDSQVLILYKLEKMEKAKDG